MPKNKKDMKKITTDVYREPVMAVHRENINFITYTIPPVTYSDLREGVNPDFEKDLISNTKKVKTIYKEYKKPYQKNKGKGLFVEGGKGLLASEEDQLVDCIKFKSQILYLYLQLSELLKKDASKELLKPLSEKLLAAIVAFTTNLKTFLKELYSIPLPDDFDRQLKNSTNKLNINFLTRMCREYKITISYLFSFIIAAEYEMKWQLILSEEIVNAMKALHNLEKSMMEIYLYARRIPDIKEKTVTELDTIFIEMMAAGHYKDGKLDVERGEKDYEKAHEHDLYYSTYYPKFLISNHLYQQALDSLADDHLMLEVGSSIELAEMHEMIAQGLIANINENKLLYSDEIINQITALNLTSKQEIISILKKILKEKYKDNNYLIETATDLMSFISVLEHEMRVLERDLHDLEPKIIDSIQKTKRFYDEVSAVYPQERTKFDEEILVLNEKSKSAINRLKENITCRVNLLTVLKDLLNSIRVQKRLEAKKKLQFNKEEVFNLTFQTNKQEEDYQDDEETVTAEDVNNNNATIKDTRPAWQIELDALYKEGFLKLRSITKTYQKNEHLYKIIKAYEAYLIQNNNNHEKPLIAEVTARSAISSAYIMLAKNLIEDHEYDQSKTYLNLALNIVENCIQKLKVSSDVSDNYFLLEQFLKNEMQHIRDLIEKIQEKTIEALNIYQNHVEGRDRAKKFYGIKYAFEIFVEMELVEYFDYTKYHPGICKTMLQKLLENEEVKKIVIESKNGSHNNQVTEEDLYQYGWSHNPGTTPEDQRTIHQRWRNIHQNTAKCQKFLLELDSEIIPRTKKLVEQINQDTPIEISAPKRGKEEITEKGYTPDPNNNNNNNNTRVNQNVSGKYGSAFFQPKSRTKKEKTYQHPLHVAITQKDIDKVGELLGQKRSLLEQDAHGKMAIALILGVKDADTRHQMLNEVFNHCDEEIDFEKLKIDISAADFSYLVAKENFHADWATDSDAWDILEARNSLLLKTGPMGPS